MKKGELITPAASEWTTHHKEALTQLLSEIAVDANATAKLTGYPVFDDKVMKALQKVPRHVFVSDRDQGLAYANRPLGIGHGQTISQPYIVALMTVLLKLKSSHKVLEVGTGSGYQTAVLAELVENVFTVELIPSLAEGAQKTLKHLGYDNIRFRTGNGRDGWLNYAPFQAIIVTAASEVIPLALIDQLEGGGRMVIPKGPPGGSQQLFLLTKNEKDTVTEKTVLPVSFVPLLD